ncbi:MAG: hypothetical protein RL432_975 [Bacteroidota bacterium]|jgi:bacillithiol system protein YtxJ
MEFFDLLPEHSLESIEFKSKDKPQIILKHSTRCIVSSMALRSLQHCDADAQCWVLDLLTYRELSNEIARRYEIMHQSPQIILLQNGKIKLQASHEEINCELIKSAYAK